MGDTEKTFARFDSLIARHRALIDHLCIRYSDNDAELCNDYRQDCYCSLWHYLPSLKENSNYFQERSWVAWHCRSVFSHHNERNRKRQFIPLTKEIADSAAESDNNEARETIEALAVTLTPYERRAILLIADGYDAEDLAKELGIKHRSAVSLRHRIIDKLRNTSNKK